MDRNKRPALTSPWKIGFLVSLLLVTVSIGVGFAITRTFGVTWSWIQISDGTWAFSKDAFLQEMLPLVVVVPLMSLIAYFLITGAVRKYRAYLDSGQDYKNLVKSIRQLGDLDENRVKSLGDFPELRDSLTKLRGRITDREKTLDEREAGITAQQDEVTAAEDFKAETRLLVGAISRGPVEGFSDELALSIPELKNAEEAIREHLLVGGVSMTNQDLGEQVAHIREELIESTESLKSMLSELTGEMVISQNGAREIETYLGRLKTAAGNAGEGTTDVSGINALVGRLDQATVALAALGEETRGVAINAALHAGQGESGLTELINLADNVRDVAARFNGISAQYHELGQLLKTTVQALDVGQGGGGELAGTIGTMTGKVTYWVERAVILAEKLNSFERYFLDTHSAFNAKLGGEAPDEDYQTVDDFTTGETAQASGGTGLSGPVDNVVDEAGPAVPATGIAGLERNKNPFEEIGGSSEDNLFADIPVDGAEGAVGKSSAHTGLTGVFERNELHPPAGEESTGVTETAEPAAARPEGMFEEMQTPAVDDEKPLAPPPSESRNKPGEFLRSNVDLSKVEVGQKSEPAGSEAGQVPADTSASNTGKDNVIDLYELGAVDYEPTIHHIA